MAIKFSLKAVPMFKVEGQAPKYAIKEMYSFVTGEQLVDSNGVVRPKFVSDGYVDEDIKAQNASAYSAFSAYYNANQDKLNALALASPGVNIDVEAMMKEAVKAEKSTKITKVVVKEIKDKK